MTTNSYLPKTYATVTVTRSAEVAEQFTNAFYQMLQNDRSSIRSLYVPTKTLPDGKILPCITWNGNNFASVEQFIEMVNLMPKLSFEVSTVDAHLLNSLSNHELKFGEKFETSILVTACGTVRLGESQNNAALRQFFEAFVIVSSEHLETEKSFSQTSWLIKNQNFRFVV